MALYSYCQKLVKKLRRARAGWRGANIVYADIAQISYGSLLRGKNVLVTGGSAGIGLAIARKCVGEGANVIITGRNTERLARAAQEVQSPALHMLQWDVGQVHEVTDRLATCRLMFGGDLDVLVNNAGILLPQSFLTTDEPCWDSTYAVNSKGPFFLTQKVVDGWIGAARGGKVINISSTGGFLGATYPYRMTKWDIAGFTQGLGEMLAPYGILVNGIAPGRTATDMLDRGNEKNLYDTYQPMKRMALPEEIAELAVFLMSGAANYVVGQTIIVDGGYTLKS